MSVDATKMNKPLIHPSEILTQEFLEPMAISQYRLSKEARIGQMTISRIIAGERAITANTALRLAR